MPPETSSSSPVKLLTLPIPLRRSSSPSHHHRCSCYITAQLIGHSITVPANSIATTIIIPVHLQSQQHHRRAHARSPLPSHQFKASFSQLLPSIPPPLTASAVNATTPNKAASHLPPLKIPETQTTSPAPAYLRRPDHCHLAPHGSFEAITAVTTSFSAAVDLRRCCKSKPASFSATPPLLTITPPISYPRRRRQREALLCSRLLGSR